MEDLLIVKVFFWKRYAHGSCVDFESYPERKVMYDIIQRSEKEKYLEKMKQILIEKEHSILMDRVNFSVLQAIKREENSAFEHGITIEILEKSNCVIDSIKNLAL